MISSTFLLLSLISISVGQTEDNTTIGSLSQSCLEESTNDKRPVIWPLTTEFNIKVVSTPLCLTESLELITRICNDSGWHPSFEDVPECAQVITKSPKEICAPGFNVIREDEINDLCYKHSESSSWYFPCLNSGSSLTVFDLNAADFLKLVNALNLQQNKHVWLPVTRIIPFGPLVWTTPGEKWGKPVDIDEFTDNNNLITISRFSIIHNCLVMDLEKFSIKTENCTFHYPTLCVARQNHLLQLHCPSGYFASQYGLNDGLCYGIHISDNPLTWNEFHDKSCPNPITIKNQYDNFLIKELFTEYDEEFDNICWTGLTKSGSRYYWQSNTTVEFVNWDPRTDFNDKNVKGAISSRTRWEMLDNDAKLLCMICQINASDKELEMEISYVSDYVQLTIYNQQRLWREEEDDYGIRCFSNAKGFQTRISITEDPFYNDTILWYQYDARGEPTEVVQKIVYRFQLLNDQSGEYWCEGHDSRNFSLVKSPKLFVRARKDEEHIFTLKMKIFNLCDTVLTCNPDWEDITEFLENILEVKSIRLMYINNISNLSAVILTHVTVSLYDDDDCDNRSCKILKTYLYFKAHVTSVFNKKRWKMQSFYKYELIYLKSTEFCLPEYHKIGKLSWDMARIGEIVAPIELCMRSDGLPVRRMCMGTFVEGADWGDIIGVCSENFEPTNRTSLLYRVAKGRADTATTNSFLVHELTTILQNSADIIPADIYFLGLSLRTLLKLSDKNSSSVEMGDSLNIATAMNSVMDIEESYFKVAQTLNSSNILLESVDMILSKIATNTTDDHFVSYRKDLVVTPHFVVQISCPEVNNISGLALLRRENSSVISFEDLDVIELTANMTLKDVLKIPNLEVATWASQDLLDNLQYQNNSNNASPFQSPRVVFSAFYNDIVFQEIKKNKGVINSRVISITIPEYETELFAPIFLIYRQLKGNATGKQCAYWNLGSKNSIGEWSKQGCFYVRNYGQLDVCACLHLTHFAQLVHGFRRPGNNPDDAITSQFHGHVLNTITVVGCSLSLAGVAGIAATAIIFPAWRQKPGSKILLQLSAALALESIIMLAQDSFHPSDLHCIVLGVTLHYSVLAAFMWMLLTALLQFARYVRVLGVQRPVRFMAKFSIVGWGSPLIPVAILLFIDPRLYLPPATFISPENPNLPPERDPSALCYPQGMSLMLSCLLPIACIVVTNLIVFVLVMHSVTKIPEGVRRPTDPDLVLAQLRLSILLFFLLGLSWIFGFLSATGDVLLFSYLFCLTATLQGFILFIYFIVCDPSTRVLWVSLVREKSISPSKTSTREISFDTK